MLKQLVFIILIFFSNHIHSNELLSTFGRGIGVGAVSGTIGALVTQNIFKAKNKTTKSTVRIQAAILCASWFALAYTRGKKNLALFNEQLIQNGLKPENYSYPFIRTVNRIRKSLDALDSETRKKCIEEQDKIMNKAGLLLGVEMALSSVGHFGSQWALAKLQ